MGRELQKLCSIQKYEHVLGWRRLPYIKHDLYQTKFEALDIFKESYLWLIHRYSYPSIHISMQPFQSFYRWKTHSIMKGLDIRYQIRSRSNPGMQANKRAGMKCKFHRKFIAVSNEYLWKLQSLNELAVQVIFVSNEFPWNELLTFLTFFSSQQVINLPSMCTVRLSLLPIHEEVQPTIAKKKSPLYNVHSDRTFPIHDTLNLLTKITVTGKMTIFCSNWH